MPRCEVVVFAHNEEANIRRSVRSILQQPWGKVELHRLTVWSTESSDRTDEIVEAMTDPRVCLKRRPIRRGKVYDVDEAVRATACERLILMDADVEISAGCLPLLVAALDDEGVGIAVPCRRALNPDRGGLGFLSHLMADVHNALRPPKAGQVLAIRRELGGVDVEIGVDDAFQEHRCIAASLEIRRVEEAVVSSLGPGTIRDFILQRRRNVAQHLSLRRSHGYAVGTLRLVPLARGVFSSGRYKRPHLLASAAALEGVARALGYWDAYVRRERYLMWRVAETTRSR